MKLRVRSLESRETHKIELPNTCNLQQLKEIINLQLFPSSSSSQHNLLLSLNRKDELFGSSPEESLRSLGVASGDLIYYTLNPYAFSSQNPNFLHTHKDESLEINSTNVQDVSLMSTQMLECGKVCEFDVPSDEHREIRDAQMCNLNDNNFDLVNTQKFKTSISNEFVDSNDKIRDLVDTHKEGTSELCNLSDLSGDLVYVQKTEFEKSDEGNASNALALELMDEKMEGSMVVTEGTDEMEVDNEPISNVNTRFSVPGFLKKVFVKEVGDVVSNGGNHKLLVIAVHAVLLESGFVGYDPISGMKVDGFHLPDEWPSSAFGISLQYTLPEVSSSEVVETVVLKFQTLGKYVNVYGSLPKKGWGVHRVCLDEPRFIPALSYVWKNSDLGKERDGSIKMCLNQEIFEFWKVVKDGLSYPLLIELCEQVGLIPPPCLMLLPTELKLKILEALPAIDVAKVACVSKELHFIASNNDLWKLKYEEEFGKGAGLQRESPWKVKFGFTWEITKKGKSVRFYQPPCPRSLFPGRRDPNPFGRPFINGGDYDRMPAFGMLQHPGRRIFRTNCGLGGFDV